MWLNQGLECAMEMGFNYSKLCENSLNCENQEQHLKDLCTSTIPFLEILCKNASSFSVALLAIVWAVNTSGVLLSFFFLIFTIRFRKNRIVKMSSPNLNVVTLLGTGLTYSSVYLFGIEKQNPLTRPSLEMLIQVRICILYIGGSLALGPILGKSWRLYRVFTQQVPDKRVVTDKGLSCTLRYGYVCKSLYSEFWFILLLGFKGILLTYGTYLAGLTDNLSCPPVNQSLTLIIAVAIIFLFIGIMLVVNSFFYLWHNLVYGLTSGGIFVCTSSINCLIFIPQQVRQWKTFEKQEADISNMAKYFTGSNKNFHSTMYSDEEIYQLLGEKNTMMQQLAEKDTAIANLQEQMNSVKEKLMRLVAIEDNHSVADSPFLSTSHLLPSHSTANFSSVATENLPFSFSQELKPWQNSKLSNSQYIAGSFSKKMCVDDLEHTDQENMSLDIIAKCRLVNKMNSGAEYDEDQWFSQSRALLTKERLHEQNLSALSKEAKQSQSSAMNQKQNPEMSSVDSENFQEILQDLGVNHITVMQTSSRGPKYNYESSMMLQPKKIQKKIPFHLSGSMASNIQCNVNKSASRMQRMSSRLIEYPWSAPRNTKDGDSLHQPPPSLVFKKALQTKPDNGFEQLYNEGYGLLLDNHLVENCASTFYPTRSRNFHYQQKDFLTRAIPGLLPFQHFYFDSGSSSSGEGTYCHQTQACEVCRYSLSSSSDSCVMIDTDSEYSMTLDSAKHYSKAQPTVNFNEDLEPTYV
ncbi:putative G-protein coupled receptor 156 isoform 1-T2 [Liasis olivaceus]